MVYLVKLKGEKMLNEKKWLNNELGLVNNEIVIAGGHDTDRAKQSIRIYLMWKTRLELRMKELSQNKDNKQGGKENGK